MLQSGVDKFQTQSIWLSWSQMLPMATGRLKKASWTAVPFHYDLHHFKYKCIIKKTDHNPVMSLEFVPSSAGGQHDGSPPMPSLALQHMGWRFLRYSTHAWASQMRVTPQKPSVKCGEACPSTWKAGGFRGAAHMDAIPQKPLAPWAEGYAQCADTACVWQCALEARVKTSVDMAEGGSMVGGPEHHTLPASHWCRPHQ